MTGGIDSILSSRVAAGRTNPQGLMNSYQQNSSLIDLLALQKLKSEKEAAARQLMLQSGNGGTPPTVREQREQELTDMTKQELAQQVGGVAQKQMSDQQSAMQRMMQGVGGLPTPGIAGMAGGGVVGYAEGGDVENETIRMSLIRKLIENGMTPEAAAVEADRTLSRNLIPDFTAPLRAITPDFLAPARGVMSAATYPGRAVVGAAADLLKGDGTDSRQGQYGAGIAALPRSTRGMSDAEIAVEAAKERPAPSSGMSDAEIAAEVANERGFRSDPSWVRTGRAVADLLAKPKELGQNIGSAAYDAVNAADGIVSGIGAIYRGEELGARKPIAPAVAAVEPQAVVPPGGVASTIQRPATPAAPRPTTPTRPPIEGFRGPIETPTDYLAAMGRPAAGIAALPQASAQDAEYEALLDRRRQALARAEDPNRQLLQTLAAFGRGASRDTDLGMALGQGGEEVSKYRAQKDAEISAALEGLLQPMEAERALQGERQFSMDQLSAEGDIRREITQMEIDARQKLEQMGLDATAANSQLEAVVRYAQNSGVKPDTLVKVFSDALNTASMNPNVEDPVAYARQAVEQAASAASAYGGSSTFSIVEEVQE